MGDLLFDSTYVLLVKEIYFSCFLSSSSSFFSSSSTLTPKLLRIFTSLFHFFSFLLFLCCLDSKLSRKFTSLPFLPLPLSLLIRLYFSLISPISFPFLFLFWLDSTYPLVKKRKKNLSPPSSSPSLPPPLSIPKPKETHSDTAAVFYPACLSPAAASVCVRAVHHRLRTCTLLCQC